MKLNKKKVLIVTSIFLIILLFIIICILNSIKKSKPELKEENFISNSVDNNNIEQKESENEELINKLKKVSESEKIRTYLGTYLKYIEKKDYGKAYELLYPEFKNNYFPTIEDFEQYMKDEYYPEMLAIKYDNISTQGEYYIVQVSIDNFLNQNPDTARTMTLIVKENDYNNYYISFKK